jgi:hypothetical protein
MNRENSSGPLMEPSVKIHDRPLSTRHMRELETVSLMIRLYCGGNHRKTQTTDGAHLHQLCPDCRELMAYAEKKLHTCPQVENKPTCLKCTIHCYDDGHRERIRNVMRYAGPRMLLRHPIMAIRHILDGRKKT